MLMGNRTPAATGGRRVSPALLVAYVFLAAMVAFAVVTAAISIIRPNTTGELAAAHAYLEAFKPLTEETGFVVEQGLKAGVVDIGSTRYDEETLKGMPEAWKGMLERLKDQMAALTVPRALRGAHEQFLASMDGYIEVTVLLRGAMDLPEGEERLAAAQRAGELGAEADQVWNAGAFMVQDHLRALGAEPVHWLPDAQDPNRQS